MSHSKIPGRPLDLDLNSIVCLLVFNETKKNSCYSSAYRSSLASSCSAHPIQSSAPGLQSNNPNFHSLIQSYVPSWQLLSASERRLVLPPQHGARSVARLFFSVVPQWWNNLPNSVHSAESLSTFKTTQKTDELWSHNFVVGEGELKKNLYLAGIPSGTSWQHPCPAELTAVRIALNYIISFLFELLLVLVSPSAGSCFGERHLLNDVVEL